uniref:Chemosensory protein 4 n=1 Tax=Pyrrhalta maculicollis TaxID=226885 RepID=A0A1J0KKH5_9CUCU|nr:chemosensory protein 4 [Pyrrhalta maculicollis]
MKAILAFLFLWYLCGISDCDKYTTKFDNVNLDEILKSDRLLKNYVDCVMDRGKCTPDGKELKDHIGDALETDCEKCSEKQRNGSVQVIKYLVKNKRPMFDELSEKYDPKGNYRNRHKEELAKEGIVL